MLSSILLKYTSIDITPDGAYHFTCEFRYLGVSWGGGLRTGPVQSDPHPMSLVGVATFAQSDLESYLDLELVAAVQKFDAACLRTSPVPQLGLPTHSWGFGL